MSKQVKTAYRYRFYPSEELKIYLAQNFGCCRFVYNKILEYSETNYLTKFIDQNPKNKDPKNINPHYKNITSNDRVKYVKTLKDTKIINDETNKEELKYPWLHQAISISLQQSARHLNDAYDRFFKKTSAKPTWKKKINRNSLTITGKDSLHFDKDFVNNRRFRLPKWKEPLNIQWSDGLCIRKDKLKNKSYKTAKLGNRLNKKAPFIFNHLLVSSVTITKEPSGKYYISFLTEKTIHKKENNSNNKNPVITAIDLGIKTTAKVYSSNINSKKGFYKDIDLPDLIKEINKRLAKAQRELSRKKYRSKNYEKQRVKVACLHEKRTSILKDIYQKSSTQIIDESQVVIIEDLNIAGMLKNRKLSKAIHNVAWSRFLTYLTYKAKWHDKEIIKVNRFYPSSKLCSHCGFYNKGLTLKERAWQCNQCQTHHDRDENACLNLKNYYTLNLHKLNSKDLKNYLNKIYHNDKFKNLNSTNSTDIINIADKTVGSTVSACGGNVRPEKQKKINPSFETKAVSCEARIPVL